MHAPRSWRFAPLLLALAGIAQAADLTITVLDRNGKPLPEAVVQLDSSMPGPRPAAPELLTITQEKMRFVPAVSVLPQGGKVSFSNLDSWDHHVIAGLTGAGGVYLDESQNVQMRLAGRVAGRPPSSEVKSFTQLGPHLLGCHLHGSMRGHLFVADSPWAKLSGGDGKLSFSGLPEGPAKLRIWHADQLLAGAPVDVVVAGGAMTLNLPTQISPRQRAKPAASPGNPGYGNGY